MKRAELQAKHSPFLRKVVKNSKPMGHLEPAGGGRSEGAQTAGTRLNEPETVHQVMCTLSADRRCGHDRPLRRYSVGIQGEGCIVARMVLPLARRTIVAAACRQYRRMEAVDGGAVWRLERKMHVRHAGPTSTQSSSAKKWSCPSTKGIPSASSAAL